MNRWIYTVGLCTVGLLSGCGGGDSGPGLAKDQAIQTIARAVGANERGFQRTIANSSAPANVSNNTGLSAQSRMPGDATAHARLREHVVTKFRDLAKKFPRSTASTNNTSLEHDVKEQLDVLMYTVESSDGTVTVYKPNAERLCAGMAPEEEGADEDCVSWIADNVRVVQRVAAMDQGTLEIKIDDYTFLVIGYAPNSVYLELDLAQLRAIDGVLSQASGGEPGFSDGDTVEGVLRLTLTRTGEESGSILFSIPQAVTIDHEGADALHLLFAATDRAVELVVDGQARTGTLGLGFTRIELSTTSVHLYETTMTQLALSGITGEFSFAGGESETMTATGVGLRGAPLDVRTVTTGTSGTTFSEHWEFSVADFAMEIAGDSHPDYHFQNGFDAAWSVEDLTQEPVAKKQATLTMVSGTRLSPTHALPNGFRVANGSVTATAQSTRTADALDGTVTVAASDCGQWRNFGLNAGQGLPVVAVICP